MERSQGQQMFLCPKKKLARRPVQGARSSAPLAIDVRLHHHIVRPDDDMRVRQEWKKASES